MLKSKKSKEKSVENEKINKNEISSEKESQTSDMIDNESASNTSSEKKRKTIKSEKKSNKSSKKNDKVSITKYLKQHKLGIAIYMFVYLSAGICGIIRTLSFAQVIVNVSNGTYMKALYNIFFILGVMSIQRLCWYISHIAYHKVSNNIMNSLNYDLSIQAFKLNSKTFSDHNTGTFVQRIVHEPERIVSNLANLVEIFTNVLTASIIIIYITTLNLYIGLIIVGIVIVGLGLEWKRILVRTNNRRELRKKADKVNSLSTEIVKSEKDIKSLGLEEKLSEVSKSHYEDYKKASYRTNMTDTTFWSIRNFIIDFVGISILILGIKLMDKSIITLATFMIVYSYRGQLYEFVYSLGSILSIFSDLKISSERMFALFDEKEFVTEKFGNVHMENVKGNIEFRNVSYSYVEYEKTLDKKRDTPKKLSRKEKKALKNNPPERKVVSTNQIFDDLSFKIEPNTTVAFVGKSGSGKTTILNLMSKMYEVDGGEVLIDDVNINDFDKYSLRKTISLVNQFPYIFDMSIKENLLLAKQDATDEEIEKAIKDASLSEFVSTLHEGLDTIVGESGIKLSGGQKQRLAIARALLRNSSIIIFDESTSSLDNFTQEDIKNSIDALKGKSTIVIVAHRLSTIKNADKIFFLDEGKIEDIGTFEYLFENNVKFKNMFYAENFS